MDTPDVVRESLVINEVLRPLLSADYSAYIVGGAVRDKIIGIPPRDYDVATSATPEDILAVFPSARPQASRHSDTYGVRISTGEIVEVSTYKEEKGHINGVPTSVNFVKSIFVDLVGRDASMNSMAMDCGGSIVDPYLGEKDIKLRVIRTPGLAGKVIMEHPIRMLRYIRFAAALDFVIAEDLESAITRLSKMLVVEPWEARSQEFMRGLGCKRPSRYIDMLHQYGLLDFVVPEMLDLDRQMQNVFYDEKTSVLEHTLTAMLEGEKLLYTPEEQLAVMLHDIGKPPTAEWIGPNFGYKFRNHSAVGSRMAEEICHRLRIPEKITQRIVAAIRHHSFQVNSSDTARRFIGRFAEAGLQREEVEARVGLAMKVRDVNKLAQKGIGVGNNHHLVKMALGNDSVVSLADLQINGHDIMNEFGIGSGPRVGLVLENALAAVMDGKVKNKRQELLDESAAYIATLAEGA